jgi:hypothetical protein
LAAVLRGRRASSTPLIKGQPEVGNGVAEQVEVGLKLVQTLPSTDGLLPARRRQRHPATYSSVASFGQDCCYDAI